ncbi:hypothetical protein Tco_1076186, partial [Tanacetum coccineum]
IETKDKDRWIMGLPAAGPTELRRSWHRQSCASDSPCTKPGKITSHHVNHLALLSQCPRVSRVRPPQVWQSFKAWSWQELVVAKVVAEVPVWVPDHPGHPHQQSVHPQRQQGHQP